MEDVYNQNMKVYENLLLALGTPTNNTLKIYNFFFLQCPKIHAKVH